MNKPFNEVVFLSLSKESQEKVECIYHIAHMLHIHRAPKLSTKEFDILYEKPLRELQAISGYMRRFPEMNRE